MMKANFWLLGLLLVFASCRKGEEKAIVAMDKMEQKRVQNIGRGSKFLLPSNPDNPYDYAGARHNEVLLAIDEHVQQTRDDTFDAKRAYGILYSKKTMGADITTLMGQVEKKVSVFERVGFEKAAAGSFNLATAGYLKNIVAFTEQLISPADYNHFVTSLVIFESAVIKDKNLNEHDRTAIFVASAIARYSAYHWAQKYDVLPKQEAGKLKGFLKYMVKLHAAVNGDIVGAIFGLCTSDSVGEIVDCSATFSGQFAWWVENFW